VTDHLETAKALLASISDSNADHVIRLTQTHALLSIAASLAALTSGPATPSVPGVAPSTSGRLLPGEAEILAMPLPRGRRCPVCEHDCEVHRMHGCDVGDCKCTAPHGRILPGDPQPDA
jgi:uncharacterized Fe-S radical SAM superfamily protein PflX